MSAARSSLAFALTLTIAAPVPAFAAAPKPVAPKPNRPTTKPFNKPRPSAKGPGSATALRNRLAGDHPELESDSLLGLMLRDAKPSKKGDIASFSSARVELTPGERVPLSTVIASSQIPHRTFKTRISAAKGAVFGKVTQSTEVYEFADSFVWVQSTGVTVADPTALAKKAPVFTRLADGRKHSVKQARLNAESKAGLAAFKKQIARYPAKHPLRLAAAKGDQTLLDAVASGVGYVEVVDTLHVPKRAPKLTAAGLAVPKISGGHLDFSKTTTLRKPKKPAVHPDAQVPEAVRRHVISTASGHVEGGAYHQTRGFVAGKTWSEGWVWERRWNVPSGYLRVTLGANYAVGLRVPIEVDTQMTPAWSCDDGVVEPQRRTFDLKMRAKAIDADAEFYRRAGMREDAIADGDELALQANVGYGVRLRLLWTTLVNRPYREAGVNWGRDFDPPQGSANVKVADVFLPASTTHTGFSIGPLSGSARLGLRVDVQGKVRTRVSALQEGKALRAVKKPAASSRISGLPRSTPQRLLLANTAWQTYAFAFNNHSKPNADPPRHYADNFGFRIDQVEYDSNWSVVPGVKVDARAQYAGYGIDGTWTYWMESARLPIGSLRLGRHRGTRTKHEELRGERVWHRDSPTDRDWCADHNPTL